MFDRADLIAAVDANVLTADQARKFEKWLKSRKGGEDASPDDGDVAGEALRFITNLNDVFITIGLAIFIFGSTAMLDGWLGGMFMQNPTLSVIIVSGYAAGASWLLAEYFGTRRRMLMPGMLLALTFVLSAVSIGGALFAYMRGVEAPELSFALINTAKEAGYVGLITGLLANAFYFWRVRLPFCFAIFGVLGLGLVTLVLYDIAPVTLANNYFLAPLIGGVASLAGAVMFDAKDPTRITRASDHAFWLHMVAAPQIMAGLLLGLNWAGFPINSPTGASIFLLALVGLTLLALVLNRRALVVASLISSIVAVNTLVGSSASNSDITFPLAATLIGVAVLFIGGGWHTARRGVRMLLGLGMR